MLQSLNEQKAGTRVTKRVCNKIVQKVAKPIFVKINALLLCMV
jgi:hypothetical protein